MRFISMDMGIVVSAVPTVKMASGSVASSGLSASICPTNPAKVIDVTADTRYSPWLSDNKKTFKR